MTGVQTCALPILLSLIQHEVVESREWISNSEFTDIIAISQMTPGPIAINSATYIGYTVTGDIWGSIIATIAVCLPALTIMLLITKFYLKLQNNRYVTGVLNGMKPMMIGMILAAGVLLLTPNTFIDYKSWIILAGAFILSLLKLNPIILIVIAGVVGILIY